MNFDPNNPAFPVIHSIDNNWTKEPIPEFRGMSIRAHFASLAMQGLISLNKQGVVSDENIAKGAVAYADALIAELNKPTP